MVVEVVVTAVDVSSFSNAMGVSQESGTMRGRLDPGLTWDKQFPRCSMPVPQMQGSLGKITSQNP